MNQIAIRSVSKIFSRTKALNELSLSVGSSEVVLLLGSNGAGKSTLLRLCSGLSRPDAGEIRVGDRKLKQAADQIGYFSHQTMTYADFSVQEQLILCSQLRNLQPELSLLQTWNLDTCAEKRLSSLSAGQRARVSLMLSFLHSPSVFLLDEPSSALDDKSVELLFSHIQHAQSAGALFLIATHDIARLEQLCSRIVVLESGQIAHDSSSSGEIISAIEYYREANR